MTSSESSLASDLDHQNRVAGAGDDEIEVALAGLVEGRIEDVFAVLVADPGGRDRAHEGNAGKGQSGRGGDQRDDVGLVLAVIGEDLSDHEDLVVEALGKERADRVVDEARGQRLLFGGAALRLKKPPGMRPAAENFS